MLFTLQTSLENRREIPKVDPDTYTTFMYDKITKKDNAKGEMDKSTIQVGKYNISLWITDRTWIEN